MDVLLLGAAAIVLIALTLWIVWRPASLTEPLEGDVRAEEASEMPPQGDQFEDQYTSATADLSAGGVAVTGTYETLPAAESTDFQRASEPWSQPEIAREGSPAVGLATETAGAERPLAGGPRTWQSTSVGLAALLAVGSAVGGAWLYSRWQKRQNQPLNRLRRRFRWPRYRGSRPL